MQLYSYLRSQRSYSVTGTHRSESRSLASSRVNDIEFMQSLASKSRQAVSRTFNEEITRTGLIHKLEGRRPKQKRASSASLNEAEEIDDEPPKIGLATRHEENLKKIREIKAKAKEAEKAKAKEWRKLMILENQKSELELERSKHNHKLRKVKTARERREFNSWQEKVDAFEIEETDYLLQNYEEKMHSHNSRYSRSGRSVSNKTTERLKRIRELNLAQEQQRKAEAEDRIHKYIKKQALSLSKRSTILSQATLRKEAKQRLLQERLMKAKQKEHEDKVQVGLKARRLEEETNQLLKNKADIWKKERSFRIETHKLKAQDSHNLSLRNKRIANTRQNQILRRHLEDQQRIEVLKQERQSQALHKRDLEIKAMIEREKVREALLVIRKSPESIRSKGLLRRYAASGSVSLNTSLSKV